MKLTTKVLIRLTSIAVNNYLKCSKSDKKKRKQPFRLVTFSGGQRIGKYGDCIIISVCMGVGYKLRFIPFLNILISGKIPITLFLNL